MPKGTAFEPDLYALSAVPLGQEHWVETEIMTKHVDTPAALVHKKLVAGQISTLTVEERNAWTRFILAQWWRSPQSIGKLHEAGLSHLEHHLSIKPEEYDAIKGDSPHGSLREWLVANICEFEDLSRLVSIGRTLPSLIADPKAGGIIINMQWRMLDLRESSLDLVLSDSPVVRLGGLDTPECLIAAPLSPTKLFLACHRNRTLNLGKLKPTQIVRGMNQNSADAAAERIFSTGERHVPLARKYLRISSKGA